MLGESREKTLVTVTLCLDEQSEDLEEICRRFSSALEAAGYGCEVIMVNDGHRARFAERLKALKDRFEFLRILTFARSFGEGAALNAARSVARGDYILTFPPYLQTDPERAVALLGKLEEGYDVATSWRFPRADVRVNRIQSALFNFFSRWIAGTGFHDLNCAVRAARKEVLEEISVYGDLYRFVPILAERKGFKVAEVQVPHLKEKGRTGFLGLGAYLKRVADLVTLFFLTKFARKPLRFFGLIGFVLALFGFILGVYLFVERLGGKPMGDRPLLLLAVLLLVLGVQAVTMGILGELVIYTQARETRDYHVEQILE